MSDDQVRPAVLLVGPRVVHLAPFFERRGFLIDAFVDGTDGLSALQAHHRDIVVLELQVGDVTSVDFIVAAKSARPDARFILLDEASRAGQIVKTMLAGLHAYVSTPPDEERLFHEVDRLLESAPRFRPSRDAMSSLEFQVQSLQSTNVEISMRADMLAQEIETSQLEIDSLKTDLEIARGDLDEKERAMERLDAENAAMPSEDEFTNLRERAAVADRLEGEKKKFDKILKERDENIADLDRRLKETSTRNAEIATELAMKEELVGNVDELRKRAASAEKKSESLDEKSADLAKAKASLVEATKAHEKTKSTVDASHKARDEALQKAREAEKAAADAEKRAVDAEKQAKASAERADAEASRVRKELEADIELANKEREKAEERAIDRELESDDMKSRIQELELLVKSLEESVRREKLRFVEQQEMSGNDDVYRKMETMSHELGRLRKERDAYEKQFGKVGGE